MAKKNLTALMNGIIGDTTPNTSASPVQISKTTAGYHSNTDSFRKPEECKTEIKASRGRPRNPDSEIRNTFIVNSEDMKKIRYIALVDEISIKDIFGMLMKEYIQDWEQKHGEIEFPKKIQP